MNILSLFDGMSCEQIVKKVGDFDSESPSGFSLFWKIHAIRQGEILDAIGEVWTDTDSVFIGYDGQEGEHCLSNKKIFDTNGISSAKEARINVRDFVFLPLIEVVNFFNSVKQVV